MNITQLAAELGAYSMTISQQHTIIRDSLPNTIEMNAWRREIQLAASRLCGRWLYEQVDRLDPTDKAAFFAAYGGEDAADTMAHENPARFLDHAMKTAMAVLVGSPD